MQPGPAYVHAEGARLRGDGTFETHGYRNRRRFFHSQVRGSGGACVGEFELEPDLRCVRAAKEQREDDGKATGLPRHLQAREHPNGRGQPCGRQYWTECRQQSVLVLSSQNQHFEAGETFESYANRRRWFKSHTSTAPSIAPTGAFAALAHSNLHRTDSPPRRAYALSLAVLVFCTVFGMCTWFSAGAVLPQLERTWGIGPAESTLLTFSVNGGFLSGALLSILLKVADRLRPSRLIAVGSVSAALLNAGLLVPGCPFGAAIVLRVLTGAAMALVYPMACKVAVTWFVDNKGLALGMVVGSVGIGSASPHLLGAVGSDSLRWQTVVGVTSGMSLGAGAAALLWLREGPHWAVGPSRETQTLHAKTPRESRDVYTAVDVEEVMTVSLEVEQKSASAGSKREGNRQSLCVVLRNRAFWLTTLGYSGHNWELYALWLWFKRFSHDAHVGALLEGGNTSPGEDANSTSGDSLATFLVVSSAFLGCIVGGLAADRVGRTTVCLCSLTVSIVGSLSIGWTVGHPALTLAIGLLWGIFAVAESAQFGAMTSELVPAELVGNAITIQFGVGFLCTMPGMFLVPMLAPQDNGEGGSWILAWSSLTPGTVIGAIAMLLLRLRPEARQVAQLRGRPSF